MPDNKKTYESKKVVKKWVSDPNYYLFKPESEMYSQLESKLNSMKMLDVGVGGGRTTYFFAKKAKEYVGIDYSKGMIDGCKQKFADLNFVVCDMRDLSVFQDSYFDFVFVAWNGLDCVDREGRLKTLKEIKRVLSKNGMLFFSSHNIQCLEDHFSLKKSSQPFTMARYVYRWVQLRRCNKNFKSFFDAPYAFVTDGANDFKTDLYYIKPAEQFKQLNDFGFKNIKIYSFLDGKEIKSSFEEIKEPWVYYSCDV